MTTEEMEVKFCTYSSEVLIQLKEKYESEIKDHEFNIKAKQVILNAINNLIWKRENDDILIRINQGTEG